MQDYVGVEQLRSQAIGVVGESDTDQTAFTSHASLGGLYLITGRLDEADAAYEARGDLTVALRRRLSYDPNYMVCGNCDVSC